MATINTIDDLVRALDENPEWVEILRIRLLSRELLDLPGNLAQLADAFAQFASATDQRMARLEESAAETSERVARLEAAMAQLIAANAETAERVARLEAAMTQLIAANAETAERVTRLEASAAETNERVGRLEAAMAQLAEAMAASDRRSHRMEVDIGRMKGHDARNAVQADGGRRVARSMNLRRTRTLDIDEIWDFTLNNDVGDIRAGDIQSFRDADVIMIAADEDGQQHYVAVEVSYSVNGRDAERAIRNAQLLRRFTAQSAYAAVAGTRINNRVQEMIDDGLVHWYSILDKDIEPR